MTMTDIVARLDPALVVDLDLASPESKRRAYDLMAEWATKPPFYVITDGVAQVVCGRYADVQAVFTDRERFTTIVPRRTGFEKFDRFMGVQTLPQTDGEPHDRLRRIMQPAFSPRAVERLHDGISSLVDRLLDGIESRGDTFDGVRDYAAPLPAGMVLDRMLGLGQEQKDAFLEMNRVTQLTTYRKPGESYPQECVDAFERVRTTIGQLIDERRAVPGDDLISGLVLARDEGDRLSDDELFDQIFTICAAALSGTAIALSSTLATLYTHPEALAEVKADLSLVPLAIEETHRYRSGSMFTFPRFARFDTEIGGTPVYEGMVVRGSKQAAHFDPTVYPDPLRFDIRRDPKGLVVFGAGYHHCIGHRMARVAMELAVSKLLERFPESSLADPGWVPEYGGSAEELRLTTLPLRIR